MLTRAVDGFVPLYSVLVLVVLTAGYQEGEIKEGIGKKRGGKEVTAEEEGDVATSPARRANRTKSGSRKQQQKNLTGTFKLFKNTNYQKFLEVQGVGWALRKAADSANVVHKIRHVPGSAFDLEVIGLVKSKEQYVIGGEGKITKIKNSEFIDTVTELGDGRVGVRITKVCKKGGYKIEVERELEGDDNIVMEQEVIFNDGRREKATQRFEREKKGKFPVN